MRPMIDEDAEKAIDILDQMGLEGEYAKLQDNYPGGEQQRLQ